MNLQAAQLKVRDDEPVELTDLWTKKQSRSPRKSSCASLRAKRWFSARAARARLPTESILGAAGQGQSRRRRRDAADCRSDDLPHGRGWGGTRGAGDRPQYAGWGGARADSAPYGQTLQVARKTYPSGIGILANSRLEVRKTVTDASRRESASMIPRRTRPAR